MATPNPPIPAEDLTKCGICKETITDPKALSCLHTFCLVCLKEWSFSDLKNDKSVMCPACKTATTLPAEGVDGLPGNFFVSSLMERSHVMGPRPNVACVCCEEVGVKFLARCLSCEGFLCEKGFESHKTWKFLKNYELVNLEDQSGKINLSSVLAKQPTCDKHKGQPLWFFCETCGELVCQACTVVNHKGPEHVYVELESVVKDQKREILLLVEKSNAISTRVDNILKDAKCTRDDLVVNAKKAASDIDNAGQTVIDKIRKLVKAEKDKLDKWVTDSQIKLHGTEEKLLSQQAQLKRAQEMATQVLLTGSYYDVASVYPQLKTSLEESVEFTSLELEHDQVVFKPNLVSSSMQSLGILTFGVRKLMSKTWMLEKEFGQDGQVQMHYPCGVTITPSSDIAVVNGYFSTPVQIYSTDGVFKRSLDKRSSGACNVVAADDGRLFVTTYNNNCVTTYNYEGQYLSEFPAISPDGVKSSDDKTELSGLALNRQRQLLVGATKRNYISIHDGRGNHVSSIRTPTSPSIFATTSQSNIIVASRGSHGSAYVIDMAGNQLTEIRCPQDVSRWSTYGMCVSQTDEICIASEQDKGIHCFSETGKYLGCIYEGLSSPGGMTLMDNDEKLLVAEYGSYSVSGTIKILTAN